MLYQQGPTVWHNNIFTAILCSWQNWQEDTEISQLLSALTNAWSFSLSISFNKMVQFLPKMNVCWHIHHKHPKTIVYRWIHSWSGCAVGKNLPANAGDGRDTVSTPGTGRSPVVENGNPLQYSCLENSMDREDYGLPPWACKDSDTTDNWAHRQILWVSPNV